MFTRFLLLSLVLLVTSVVETMGGVKLGKTYYVCPVTRMDKGLFINNSSLEDNANVLLWTNTNVPAQQWMVVGNRDGSVSLQNVYTTRFLACSCNPIGKLAQLVQVATSESDWAKWILIPVKGKGDTFRLVQQHGMCNWAITQDSKEDGAKLMFESVDDANANQMWKFVETEPKLKMDETIRKQMADAFLFQFLLSENGGKTFTRGSWQEAEILETMLDLYQSTGERKYLDVFEDVFGYFISQTGDDWLHLVWSDSYKWYGHDFNDDVMWMVIASARAFLLIGDKKYLDYAKHNFDAVYNRAINPWGMMRWAQISGAATATNSCINGPTEVAACYIAQATGDESYYEKARSLYANQRKFLYNEQSGEVWDSFSWNNSPYVPENYNRWVSTYNQGTMLGAAIMLYQHFGDSLYVKDANQLVTCVRKQLCNQYGIIKVCQEVDGDRCGFKGILMRYMRRYAQELGHEEIMEWLRRNAFHAYNNMNSKGIACSAWLTKSSEDGIFEGKNYMDLPFGCSTAVSAVANVPLDTYKSKSVTKKGKK